MMSRRSDPDLHKGFAATRPTRPKESNFGLVERGRQMTHVLAMDHHLLISRCVLMSYGIDLGTDFCGEQRQANCFSTQADVTTDRS